jgi:transcriptional regulator
MHMAKNNPQWREFFDDEVLVVFSGPHSYVSPRWYEQKERVPTWNYAAVHAYGTVKMLEGRAAKHAGQERLVATHDPEWLPEFRRLREQYVTEMLEGIVNFEIKVTRLEPRWEAFAESRAARDGVDRRRARQVHGQQRAGARGVDAQALRSRVAQAQTGAGACGCSSRSGRGRNGRGAGRMGRAGAIAHRGQVDTPESIHLTLVFLGEVAEERLETPFVLQEACAARVTRCRSSRRNAVTQRRRMGGANEKFRARLPRLFNRCALNSRRKGSRSKHGCSPPCHADSQGPPGGRAAAPAARAWPVTEFTLVRSTLSRHGSSYSIVDRITLA